MHLTKSEFILVEHAPEAKEWGMKQRFSEEPSIQIRREAETHGSHLEVCRRDGCSEQRFDHWRRKYQGRSGPACQRLTRLESEHATRTRVVAEPAWAMQGLQERLTTTGWPCASADGAGAAVPGRV